MSEVTPEQAALQLTLKQDRLNDLENARYVLWENDLNTDEIDALIATLSAEIAAAT